MVIGLIALIQVGGFDRLIEGIAALVYRPGNRQGGVRTNNG